MLLTLIVAAGAAAASMSAPTATASYPRDTPALLAAAADLSAGKLVQGPEGNVIGTVRDVLPNPATGQPDYALIATDTGATAVPAWAISHLLRDAHLVVDRSVLAAAPRVGADEFRNDTNTSWKSQADSYWRAYR